MSLLFRWLKLISIWNINSITDQSILYAVTSQKSARPQIMGFEVIGKLYSLGKLHLWCFELYSSENKYLFFSMDSLYEKVVDYSSSGIVVRNSSLAMK